MIQASRTEESNNDFQITHSSLPNLQPNPSLKAPTWLKRARIITALVYILLQVLCFVFIIICIVRSARCIKAPKAEWWRNGLILRFSNHSMTFNDIIENLTHYQKMFNMDAIWICPVFPLSNKLNPLTWKKINGLLGEKADLINLIKNLHDKNIQIIVDYPINHLSIQSDYFTDNDDLYFVWNEQGNTSNWMTIDNVQQSPWTFNDRKNSFYLHQFGNDNDSIDINYRNNRVLNDMIDSFSYWDKNFQFDGYNLAGLSYAYEDYEYSNQTDENRSRTRHLEEDYLLLARIRSEIDKKNILIFDSIDSLATKDEKILARYYGDQQKALGGVQLASLDSFILVNTIETNLTKLFQTYYDSIYFKQEKLFLWSSISRNSKLNEAFFAACLFHNGTVSIDIGQNETQLTAEQIDRIRVLADAKRTLDVFRVGIIKQKILSQSNLLKIERTRSGSKSYMIIVNFNDIKTNDRIHIDDKPSITEIFLTNNELYGKTAEKDRTIKLADPIHLEPYEYLVIRWSPPMESLRSIF